LVIGYDTRFASEDFAIAVAGVFAGNGIKVYLCNKSTPTPVVSFGVVNQKAGGAIIITASHNPAKWNGFKFRIENGASAPSEVIAELEKHIAHASVTESIKQISLEQARQQGLVEYIDLTPAYFDRIASLIDLNAIRQARMKVIIDPMHGAGAGYLKTLLDGGVIKLIEINGERNPAFPGIQPEPIAVNLAKLSAAVRNQKANVGLASDGDADRIGVIDENGDFITQLQVFALLCLYLLEIRGERGPIVKTITTTSMVDRLGEIYKVPVHETSVGFKYVAPIMESQNAIIGGEESGGYGFRGHIPERDAIIASLYFLDLMVKSGKSPTQLLDYLYRQVGPHYYERIDIEFPASEHQRIVYRLKSSMPRAIEGVEVVKTNTTDGFRFILADNTWLLIRFSGTEPILRIYTESDSKTRVKKLLDFGRSLAGV
jgi:phosphomannomutase